MANAPFLWIALDGLSLAEKKTIAIVEELDKVEGNFGFKVNQDWIVAGNLGRVAGLSASGRPTFVDLKMWNGSRTMTSTFLCCHNAGISATNAYALADDQLKNAILDFRGMVPKTKLRIFALTVLSHYDNAWAYRHFGAYLFGVMLSLAEDGVSMGADGIICPKFDHFDDMTMLKVHPGCRPNWYARDGRHEWEFTPESVAGRNDVEVVCGSPIMKSDDPVAALNKVLTELSA